MNDHKATNPSIEAATETRLRLIEKIYEQNQSQSRTLTLLGMIAIVISLLIIISGVSYLIIHNATSLSTVTSFITVTGAALALTTARYVFRVAKEYNNQAEKISRMIIEFESYNKAISFLLQADIDAKTRERITETVISQLLRSSITEDTGEE